MRNLSKSTPRQRLVGVALAGIGAAALLAATLPRRSAPAAPRRSMAVMWRR